MMKNQMILALGLAFALLAIFPLAEAGEIRVYLNATAATVGFAGNLTNQSFPLTKNVSIDQRINHSFTINTADDIDIVFRASNLSGHLVRFRLDHEGAGAHKIQEPVNCSTSIHTIRCTGCGIAGFTTPRTFKLQINSTPPIAQLFIDDVPTLTLTVCTEATSIGDVQFSPLNIHGGAINYNRNLLIANNLPPIFLGNLSNMTWNEDTSAQFNISSNYTDPNNDSLSYNYSGFSGPIVNISISINNLTGIVNITPPTNYFGSQIVQFFAFDGDNITGSNLINLTVLNVNDAPNVSSVLLSDTDSLNRSNGTLLALWSYTDIENDLQSGNETRWYLNGSEETLKRNLTSLTTAMTNKTQNWTFSVSAFDGANFSAFINSTPLLILNSPPQLASSVPDRSWEQDTTESFSLSGSFSDEDSDALTYNFTPVSGVSISIDNGTQTVTLTPDFGFSGSATIVFSALDGESFAESNNVTLTVTATPLPSTSSSSGGGGGGGGYTCRLDWECSAWSACEDLEQERDCTLADVTPFRSLRSCPQNTIPPKVRECEMEEEIKESCIDGIKNQDEEDKDCGGVCEMCAAPEQIATEEQSQQEEPLTNQITGAVIGGGNRMPWIIAGILAVIVLSIFHYAKFFTKTKNLTQEEVNRILKESGTDQNYFERPKQ